MLTRAGRWNTLGAVAVSTLCLLPSLCVLLVGCAAAERGERAHARRSGPEPQQTPSPQVNPEPLVIGESLMVDSKVLTERRRINVFTPTMYGEAINEPLPVLYMLDGGMSEDFLHVAGLVQVLVSNGTMRPFLLVGIENTQRRRDLTGPTTVAEDLAIAPVVGGSAAFREFLKNELMPMVKARYRTTSETAIVGESLAGLFVLETLVHDPDMFSAYIAFDPSLWWNGGHLVTQAREKASIGKSGRTRTVFIATSDEKELANLGSQMSGLLARHAAAGISVRHVPFPSESHATVYHPAALVAFRTVFALAKGKD